MKKGRHLKQTNNQRQLRIFMIWIIGSFLFLLSFKREEGRFFLEERMDSIAVKKNKYTFLLDPRTLSYRVRGSDGKVIISPHDSGGIRYSVLAGNPLSGHLVQVLQEDTTTLRMRVANSDGLEAEVDINCYPDYFSMEVLPSGPSVSDSLFTIDFCSGGATPAFGLGDHGGYGESTAITDFTEDDFGNRDNAHRFISTFAIFPKQSFAQVLFENRTKRVSITGKENRLGVAAARKAKIYYFIGSPKNIYARYKEVQEKEGYTTSVPRYRFFQLGYEAFGSLGWNTYQQSVEADIRKYLKAGFPLKWAVVGSGFWRGERRNPREGSTTSFGLWDEAAEGGRRDGLPAPRYPDVAAFKAFFKNNGIDLLLGLRINFKAPDQYGGYYDPVNDGAFTLEGLRKQYFVQESDGTPATFNVNFPQGKVFLLDAHKQEAIDWYVQQADRWGVQGFKEDLMLKDGAKLNNDAKADAVNGALIKQSYLLMARNGAYAVPGDILRLEDTQYGLDQDRPVINGLNYAASGAAAVYLDIVGGKYLKTPLTDDQERYFVRNALLAAVSPVMAMGLGPWHLRNKTYQAAVRKAADWHGRFAAYLYSAAVQSYESGYPFAMTPLPVAFPADSLTYGLASKRHKQYAWLVGESLLATPLYGSDYGQADKRSVYLPKGRWIDYESGRAFDGPRTLADYPFPVDKLPLFVGGKGLLVAEEGEGFYAHLYPVSQDRFTYIFHFPETHTTATVKKNFEGFPVGNLIIRDLTSGEQSRLTIQQGQHYWRFKLLAKHQYIIEKDT